MDLNADIGEGGPQDAALIALVSSANIACGGHAGDEALMRDAIDACLAAGVAIGAHPGYEDPAHFGRRELDLAPEAVADAVARQVSRMVDMTARAGSAVHHVKPHGALYHQANHDPVLAAAVAEAVAHIIPGSRFYAPPMGHLAVAAAEAGLTVRGEGFMDRRYADNGGLVSRSVPGAVIEDAAAAVSQALEMALNHRVLTAADTWFPMAVETLCVHGDSLRALEILSAVRQELVAAGFSIRA